MGFSRSWPFISQRSVPFSGSARNSSAVITFASVAVAMTLDSVEPFPHHDRWKLPRPDGDAVLAVRAVAQVGRGGGADAGGDRGARLPLVADRLDPVGQVQQLALGLLVEVAAARPG